MTKAEIKRRYMKTIKPRVDEAMEYAGQPNFDMLYETCLGPSAYSLFFPMSDVLFSTELQFDALCDVYGYLRYCWLDDGSASLVCAYVTIEGREKRRVFVMYGDCDELSAKEVEKHATKHGPEGVKLKSFIATRFYPQTLKFLHGLLPAQEAALALGKQEDSYEEYFEAEQAIMDTCEKYIQACIKEWEEQRAR